MIPTLLLLAACQTDAIPPSCARMCEAGAALYGGCLEGWGVDWTAAGYEDEADYLASCETWAWELRLLEEDAGEEGCLAMTCEERAARFEDEAATCDTYTDTDWSEAPCSR